MNLSRSYAVPHMQVDTARTAARNAACVGEHAVKSRQMHPRALDLKTP